MMNETLIFSTTDSPAGELLIAANGEAITWLCMETRKREPRSMDGWRRDDDWFRETRAHLGVARVLDQGGEHRERTRVVVRIRRNRERRVRLLPLDGRA